MAMLDLAEFDLSALPTAESDTYEFKSSQTPTENLKAKLASAVSGLGNAGGGYFIAGVDDSGDPDGGLKKTVGRQDLRDWVDQIAHQVEPTPAYDVKLIETCNGRGTINADCCVVVVAVDESHSGPHMAPDGCYYVRAGAHTVRARHFIVDAIWAKRHFAKPRLTHVFRLNPRRDMWIQLGIVALTPTPAIDVGIDISPLGGILKTSEGSFPLQIPAIDRDNPFFFDVTTYYHAPERFGRNVQLRVTYKDLANNPYVYETSVSPSRSIAPLLAGGEASMERIAKSLESIKDHLEKNDR